MALSLAALQPGVLHTFQAPDPLKKYAAIASIQATQQEAQLRGAQIQEANQKLSEHQKSMQDAEAVHQALVDAGGDFEKALPAIKTINPQFGIAIEKEILGNKNINSEMTNREATAKTAAAAQQTSAAAQSETARKNAAEEQKAKDELARKNAEEAAGTLIGSPYNGPNNTRMGFFRMRQPDGSYVQGEREIGTEGAPPRAQVPGTDIPFPADVEAQRIRIANSEKVDPAQVLNGVGKDGKPGFFMLDKKTGTVRHLEDVAPVEKKTPSDAPMALKNQIPAAMTTLEMIDKVRGFMKAKPYLVGPAAGRANQAAQGIGTTFGLQNQQDEKDAATLAGHLGYLFANEVRSAMPGRPNPEIVKKLEEVSAQMKQNPNMLEGFLKSAENNANITVDNGATYNIPEAVALKAKRGGSSGSLKAMSTDDLLKALNK